MLMCIFFLHPCYHYLLVPGADVSKAGGDFLPWVLQPSRLQRTRVICYVRRDTRFRERKKEVERKTGKKGATSRPAGA